MNTGSLLIVLAALVAVATAQSIVLPIAFKTAGASGCTSSETRNLLFQDGVCMPRFSDSTCNTTGLGCSYINDNCYGDANTVTDFYACAQCSGATQSRKLNNGIMENYGTGDCSGGVTSSFSLSNANTCQFMFSAGGVCNGTAVDFASFSPAASLQPALGGVF